MENLSFEIEAKLKKLTKGLDRASAEITSFTKKNEARFKKFGESAGRLGQNMSVALTLPLVALGAASVKAASDFEETESKFNTVFKNIQKDAQDTADELRNAYGLSSKASLQLLSDTGDLLTGFGFSQKAALDLSGEVNKLAVDLASFTNFSGGAEGASQALTKALLGERESVKSLGISILETDVQAKVLENTQKGLTFESNRQAKAFATLQIAQEQSKNAIGDYARTSGGFANQMRLLQSRVSELGVEFGKILLPFVAKLVKVTQRLIKWFSDLDAGTKKIIVVVASLVAAAGPLLILLGGIASALPTIMTGLTALTGPIGLIIAGVTALIAALGWLAYEYSKLSEGVDKLEQGNRRLIKSKKETFALYSKETALAKKQVDEVKELVRIAKDHSLSIEKRKSAVEELNKISPEYLGNLTLENINTTKATKSIKKYTSAILENAKALAVTERVQAIQEKIIKLELSREKELEKAKQRALQLALKRKDTEVDLAQVKRITNDAIDGRIQKLKDQADALVNLTKAQDKNTDSVIKNDNAGNSEAIAPQSFSEGAIPMIEFIFEKPEQLDTMLTYLSDFEKRASNIVSNEIANTFAQLGQVIGNGLVNGGNVVKELGATLLSAIGQIASELGKAAIAIGVGMLAIKASFTNPFTAIAAGVALVAIGGAISSVAQNTVGQVGGGGGTGATATGGGVDNNFTQSFAANREIILKVRGRDLVAVLNNQTNFNNAIG